MLLILSKACQKKKGKKKEKGGPRVSSVSVLKGKEKHLTGFQGVKHGEKKKKKEARNLALWSGLHHLLLGSVQYLISQDKNIQHLLYISLGK